MISIPILSFLIFLPIIAIIIVLTIRDKKEVSLSNIRYICILTSAIHFVLSLYLLINFDKISTHYQFTENFVLVSSLKFTYSLGLDGISLLFLVVSSFLMLFVFLFVKFPLTQIKIYAISYLVILSASCGTFLSTDIVFFFIFYEISIIPVFFIIGIFGSSNKFYTTFKFFLYTFFSSIFLLIGITYLISHSYSSYIPEILSTLLSYDIQKYLFWLFFIGFAIKVALFPMHTWLPDTYASSPLSLNIILSGIIMKYGIYGFIRFVLPLFPLAIANYLIYIYSICLITLVYAGLIAMKQPNLKRLFAYFSMSHIALIVAGIFSTKNQGLEGAIFHSISHSILNAGFFAGLIIMQTRLNSDNIKDFKGLAHLMPKFSLLFFIIGLAGISFPLTNTFIGEFLILLGIFQDNRIFSLFLAFSILISAIVVININKHLLFSKANDLTINFKDITKYEFLGLFSISFIILLMGIYPDSLLDNMHISIAILLEKIKTSIMIN